MTLKAEMGGLKSAFREAGTKWRKVAGSVADPHLRMYNKLQTQDFDEIRSSYGLERTAAYIRSMEMKKMGVE
jgi:bisphosphoglycerate-dependent phosphoglycerate mutase